MLNEHIANTRSLIKNTLRSIPFLRKDKRLTAFQALLNNKNFQTAFYVAQGTKSEYFKNLINRIPAHEQYTVNKLAKDMTSPALV